MSNRDKKTGPSHMAPKGRGKTGKSSSAGRHGAASSHGASRQSDGSHSRDRQGSTPQNRRRQEPLRDNYYYEEPPAQQRKRTQEFEDISSYSSDRKRKEAQRDREQEGRQKQKKKGGGWKAFLIAFLVVLLIAGAGAYYVFGYMLRGLTVQTIQRDREELVASDVQTVANIKNIALFGLDARDNENAGRSDALMILTVDNKHNKVKITSILRDSEVEIEGCGSDKITHAYAYGGPELAVQTINRNFHLDIMDYVTVNFIEMAEIVDAFGGVRAHITYDEMNEINANLDLLQMESYDAEISDYDYMYEDGDVLLNGNQAVAYARIRHLEGGDDMRASRQQEVLRGLINSMRGRSKLEYPDLVHNIMPMTVTSLDFGDIMGMVPIMFTDFTMETLSIPGEEEEAYGELNEEERWVYRYDLEAASRHISRFIYEEDSPYYTGGQDPAGTDTE